MKSVGLLSSNLPSVIDRLNLNIDKFDRSMTRSKLLDNYTTLFIFYFYSNDDPRDPENRRQNRFSERRFSERRFSEQTSYNRLNGKAWLTAVVRLSANIPTPMSVDLIGEKNQVILESTFNAR